jgi:hypothetical protein
MKIVIATLLAIVCLAPTSAVLAQRGGAIDCQRDISCFAQASANCGRATVEVHVAIPLQGTVLDSTQSYEILGIEGERCLFRSRVERIATRLPGAGVAREQLEQQRAVIAAILSGIEWLNVTCRFAPDELTEMLDRWVTTPIVANAEFDRPECRSGRAIGGGHLRPDGASDIRTAPGLAVQVGWPRLAGREQ